MVVVKVKKTNKNKDMGINSSGLDFSILISYLFMRSVLNYNKID
jgi:hypothetical protein